MPKKVNVSIEEPSEIPLDADRAEQVLKQMVAAKDQKKKVEEEERRKELAEIEAEKQQLEKGSAKYIEYAKYVMDWVKRISKTPMFAELIKDRPPERHLVAIWIMNDNTFFVRSDGLLQISRHRSRPGNDPSTRPTTTVCCAPVDLVYHIRSMPYLVSLLWAHVRSGEVFSFFEPTHIQFRDN